MLCQKCNGKPGPNDIKDWYINSEPTSCEIVYSHLSLKAGKRHVFHPGCGEILKTFAECKICSESFKTLDRGFQLTFQGKDIYLIPSRDELIKLNLQNSIELTSEQKEKLEKDLIKEKAPEIKLACEIKTPKNIQKEKQATINIKPTLAFVAVVLGTLSLSVIKNMYHSN